MIWRVTKPGAADRAKCRWHNWFAWYPVRVPTKGRMSQQHKVWLQTVRRKGAYQIGFECCYWSWLYVLPGGEYQDNPKERYAPMPECKPPKEI